MKSLPVPDNIISGAIQSPENEFEARLIRGFIKGAIKWETLDVSIDQQGLKRFGEFDHLSISLDSPSDGWYGALIYLKLNHKDGCAPEVWEINPDPQVAIAIDFAVVNVFDEPTILCRFCQPNSPGTKVYQEVDRHCGPSITYPKTALKSLQAI